METTHTDYDKWHDLHKDEDDIHAPWHNFIKVFLTAPSEGALLEIGCGRGALSNYIAGNFRQLKSIYACDYSKDALEIAARKYGDAHGKITWQFEDIMKLSFPKHSFDSIVCCETIEHVPRPDDAIRELYRVLKPGGSMFLTCPNYFNPFGIWCLYRWLIGKPFTEGGQPYVNYIKFPTVYYWLKKTGFRVQRVYTSEFIIPARVPKTFYHEKTPWYLTPFGHRSFYVLSKPRGK